jgi:hypothetical protein
MACSLFPTDRRSFTIKIQSHMPMNLPSQKTVEKKPLVPGLFQIAALANDFKIPMQRAVFAFGRSPFSEVMLNPQKLEAILQKISKLEKPAPLPQSWQEIALINQHTDAQGFYKYPLAPTRPLVEVFQFYAEHRALTIFIFSKIFR